MILGIDLGSNLFKAAVFDGDLTCRGAGTAPVVYALTAGSRVEMPVPEAEAAFAAAMTHALRSASIKEGELHAIAITSQAQTFTVRSPAGDARIPFISWRDTHCESHHRPAAALTDFAQHCSVDECLPLLLVAKLAWLQDASEGGLVGVDGLVLMLPTWFVLQLTGIASLDDNLAAMSGLYSLREGDWWDEALRLCAIRRRNLPSLAGLGTVAGRTAKAAERYGLPPGIPVVLAGNDQTAGAYAAGLHAQQPLTGHCVPPAPQRCRDEVGHDAVAQIDNVPGRGWGRGNPPNRGASPSQGVHGCHAQDALLITLGTAQVAYVVCERVPPPAPGVMRGPYPGRQWYQLVADDHGAGTVAWARSVLDGCAGEADFDRAAKAAAADCGGVRFIADGLAGSGHWVGETSRTTAADKARAVLLCLVERMAEMLGRLPPTVIEKRLLVAGGGSQSDAWLDCLQQRLGKPLHRIEAAAPTLGAARMARGHVRPTILFTRMNPSF
jgi:sugar (pentulose or hexulose) kinase